MVKRILKWFHKSFIRHGGETQIFKNWSEAVLDIIDTETFTEDEASAMIQAIYDRTKPGTRGRIFIKTLAALGPFSEYEAAAVISAVAVNTKNFHVVFYTPDALKIVQKHIKHCSTWS